MSEIKDYLSMLGQRLSNPLLFALTASWFAINHEYLFIWLSADPVAEKYRQLEEHIYAPCLGMYPWFFGLLRFIVLPIAFAIAYIKFMPWIQKRVVKVWGKGQKEVIDEKNIAEGKIFIPEEEREKINNYVEELHEQIKKLLAEKTRVISHRKSLMGAANNVSSLKDSFLREITEENRKELLENMNWKNLDSAIRTVKANVKGIEEARIN